MLTIPDVVTRPPNANAFGQSAASPVPIMSANVVADPTILVPSRPLVTLVVFRFLSMANLILLQFGFGQLVTVADRPSWSLCYVTSPAMLKQLLLTSRVMTVTVTTTLSTCPCSCRVCCPCTLSWDPGGLGGLVLCTGLDFRLI